MPQCTYQTCDTAAQMAQELIENEKFEAMLRGTVVDKIAFIHASGKKQPKSLPTPMQIKALSPLLREISGGTVFYVVIYDEWFTWPEAKKYAALLDQLILINNDGRVTFDDGKLKKYNVLTQSYMVDNYGVYWTAQTDVRHPLNSKPGTLTFNGDSGTARGEGPVTQVIPADELNDLDTALEDIPDEIEN